MKQIPINITNDGCAFTIRARYNGACLQSLTGGGGYYPNTGVMEICEDEKLQKGFNTTTDGVSRCLRASYYKIGSYRVFKKQYMAVIEMYKEEKYRIRKFTPTECFALMGVREEEIKVLKNSGISDSQLYKMAGNSIVVDVLMGIFKQMFDPAKEPKIEQLNFPWWG